MQPHVAHYDSGLTLSLNQFCQQYFALYAFIRAWCGQAHKTCVGNSAHVTMGIQRFPWFSPHWLHRNHFQLRFHSVNAMSRPECCAGGRSDGMEPMIDLAIENITLLERVLLVLVCTT
jgi:hypothetical protein